MPQRPTGCLVIADNTGNVVCNTSFTNQQGENEDGRWSDGMGKTFSWMENLLFCRVWELKIQNN